jgi:predicted MFS family arabinose efflux permease
MTTIAISTDTSFARSRLAWLGYALTACFAFSLSLLGPIMPFLAAKIGLTFAQIGYHFTLMAVGVVFISLIGDKLAKRLGNEQMAWGGALLIGIALPGVTLGSSLMVTMPSIFLYGCGIGVVALISNTTIAISARQHAAKAYTEANIAAGILMVIGPILAGLIAKSPLGWQAIACLPLIFVGLLKIFFWNVSIPAALPGKDNTPKSAVDLDNRPLPPLFWVFGILMFFGVAIEWMVSSLGASFLTTVVGFEVSTAVALLSVFAVAIVLGRLIGRRLLEIMTESRLLILSLIWVLLTFPIYWLSTLPLLNVIGMFLIGLGVGNLVPLSMSGAMTVAGEATNRASARLGMFPSLATVTMVQLLSILADQFGIQRAYALMIVVVIVAIAVAASTNRLRRATV